MTARSENTPAVIVKRVLSITSMPSAASFLKAKRGTPAVTIPPASIPPRVRKVERDCLSPGSGEIEDAIEP